MWVSIIDTPATIAGATTKTIVYTGCPAQTFGWFALFTMRNSGVFRRGSIGSTAGNGRIPSDERRQEAASAGAGGARRNRTDDLLLAKQALSQLSYGPVGRKARSILIMVGLGRLELPTSRLSGVRSNHLSYRPDAKHTSPAEDVSSCLKKEKRRRRRSALVSRIRPDSFRPVRCLGRADRTGVSADPEGSSLERR